MAVLGDDGRGYELACKLEQCGVWRCWLGEHSYAAFVHFLSSPALWETFMRTDDARSRAQIHLQLRARALLFDKAAMPMFLCSHSSRPGFHMSNLNPGWLQLHVDDVYFSLEDGSCERTQLQDCFGQHNCAQYKAQSRLGFNPSRSSEHSLERAFNVSLMYSEPGLHGTWYDQLVEKYRCNGHTKLYHRGEEHTRQSWDGLSKYFRSCEKFERTPERMFHYIKLYEKHKRRRCIFKNDHNLGLNPPTWHSSASMPPMVSVNADSSSDEDSLFVPELMFPLNCVPDSALGLINYQELDQRVDYFGIFGNLLPSTIQNTEMTERFGIKPEYLKIGLERCKFRGSNDSEETAMIVSEEQANRIAQKVIALLLENVGMEGASESSMTILSRLLICHICKLSHIIRVLSDSYKKQCSAIELLKMFLHLVGYSNLWELAELLKDGLSGASVQRQHQVLACQSLLQKTHQGEMYSKTPMLLSQKVFIQQQQLDKSRKCQAPTSCGSVTLSSCSEQHMAEVKESSSDLSVDGGTLTSIHRQELDLRQQLSTASRQSPSGRQLKQIPFLQIPQNHTLGISNVRQQPVKVEGFQELMSGETTPKREAEEQNRLTSPSK